MVRGGRWCTGVKTEWRVEERGRRWDEKIEEKRDKEENREGNGGGIGGQRRKRADGEVDREGEGEF